MGNIDHEMPYHAVSYKVPRTPFGPIQLRPKNCPKISNRNLHRVCSRPLCLTRNIIRRPAQSNRDGGKDARRNYDCSCIRHSWPAAGEEYNVPDDTYSRAANDERRSSLRPLCQNGNRHGRDEGSGIGRNREKLCLGRAIAQVINDGGEKETECIDRQGQGVETETVEVDLWVPECLNDTMPGKPLVSSSVAIILEPC